LLLPLLVLRTGIGLRLEESLVIKLKRRGSEKAHRMVSFFGVRSLTYFILHPSDGAAFGGMVVCLH